MEKNYESPFMCHSMDFLKELVSMTTSKHITLLRLTVHLEYLKINLVQTNQNINSNSKSFFHLDREQI